MRFFSRRFASRAAAGAAAAATLLVSLVPAAVGAQAGPPAVAPPPPGAAPAGPPGPAAPGQPRLGPGVGRAGRNGTIVAVRPYAVQIRLHDGRFVTLHLHRGTVINPLGTTLADGMHIAYDGRPEGPGSIAVDRIDLAPPLPPPPVRPRDAAANVPPPAPPAPSPPAAAPPAAPQRR